VSHEEDENAFDAPLPVRETRGFTREQMVACESCARANPPTRMNCLYCGATLPFNEATAALRRPALRPLEEWEQGFNVVLLPRATGATRAEQTPAALTAARDEQRDSRDERPDAPVEQTDSLAEAAALLRLETDALREMLGARVALPLARAAKLEEAMFIEERLRALGFGVEIVPDEVLAVETSPPARVRRLEFEEEGLKGWSGVGGEARAVGWDEVALLVRGHLFAKRVEVEEGRGRLGMEKSLVEAREMFEDESVLDVFTNSAGGGAHWRIAADNFDYTSLGARKTLLARENFLTLVETLRTRAVAAPYDDEYRRLRHLLAAAWPLSERTASGGLRRERPGKFNVEAVTHISNETQFTRYARLRLHSIRNETRQNP
jgi:hypothetical protein